MKILITGAAGHIGSHLISNIHRLKKINKIYLVDNIISNKFSVLFKISNKKFKFLYGDLVNKKFCNSLPKVDIVVHLASITNSEKSFDDKKFIYQNNLGCFNNILKYCSKNKVRLIHISSTSVYGSKNGLIDEKSKFNPLSPYAEIKVKEEKNLKKFKKIKYVSLRFGTISGFSNGMNFHTAVNKFCFNSVMNIPIPIWGKALNLYRPYLSLNDAYKIIKYVIEKNFFPNDVFNIFSENKTVKQILNHIKKENFQIKIRYVNSKILNHLSFMTSKKKIQRYGLKLNSKISNDISKTLKKLKLS